MKIAVLSSLAQDTGCYLRAGYLAESLKSGSKVTYLKPLPRGLPFMLDILLSMPINIVRVALNNSDVFIAIKPFPNVTIPLMIKNIISKRFIVIDIDDLDSGYRKGLLSQVNSFIQKPFPKHFDMITYHNSLLKEHIGQEFKVENKKVHKLPQGVDLKVFNYKIKAEELRKKFPKDKKIVVFMGHLNIASDLDDAIKAMKIVQGKKKEDIIFIVAGGGPAEAGFKKLARKLKVKAYFTGHISKEKIRKYVAIADLCLVYYKDKPANYYRCSMKLRECMAMGKKVVCNDVGELKEFKEYCYMSKTGIEEYAKKIIEALKTRDKREEKARKLIEREYNWEKIGKDFLKELNSDIKN